MSPTSPHVPPWLERYVEQRLLDSMLARCLPIHRRPFIPLHKPKEQIKRHDGQRARHLHIVQ